MAESDKTNTAAAGVDASTLTIQYLQARHEVSGWRRTMDALFAETSLLLGEDDVVALLRRVGESVAATCVLPPAETLSELEGSMNGGLDLLGWGWVQLSDQRHLVRISYGGYPVTADGGVFAPWFVPLMEGLFTRWMVNQGAEPTMQAWLAKEPKGVADPFEFEFGRFRP